MNRREVVNAIGAIGIAGRAYAQALYTPLYLRLMRATGWEELMARNQCIGGTIYRSSSGFPISQKGFETILCYTLELAWRNNENYVSAIPMGTYSGTAIDPSDPADALGWRLRLDNVPGRTDVRIHVGRRTSNTVGCILVGARPTNDSTCLFEPGQSTAAIQTLKTEYGADTSRLTVVKIEAS